MGGCVWLGSFRGSAEIERERRSLGRARHRIPFLAPVLTRVVARILCFYERILPSMCACAVITIIIPYIIIHAALSRLQRLFSLIHIYFSSHTDAPFSPHPLNNTASQAFTISLPHVECLDRVYVLFTTFFFFLFAREVVAAAAATTTAAAFFPKSSSSSSSSTPSKRKTLQK